MISRKFGFTQGRMTMSRSKKMLQFFPQKNWKKEISLAKNNGFTFIEYIGEKKFNKLNPIWSKRGLKQIAFFTNYSREFNAMSITF